MSSNPKIDYITFSGSGEPTLNSKIGDVMNFIKKNYPEIKIIPHLKLAKWFL